MPLVFRLNSFAMHRVTLAASASIGTPSGYSSESGLHERKVGVRENLMS